MVNKTLFISNKIKCILQNLYILDNKFPPSHNKSYKCK